MKEFRFEGLDSKANIIGGLITAMLITAIVSVIFIFYKDVIKSRFIIIMILLLSTLISFTIFNFFIMKYLNKEWRIAIAENHTKFFYNHKLVKQISVNDIKSVKIATSEGDRRYLKIIDNTNKKLVVQIQSYAFIDKKDYKYFDEFKHYFSKKLDASFHESKSTEQGYTICNFTKK